MAAPVSAYSGWPTVARRRNGDLLLVWSGDREAHVCPFGRVLLSVSRDEGETWTAPRVILDTDLDDRDAGVVETEKGTLLVSTFTSLAYEQSKRSLQQTEDNAILSVRDALRRLRQTRLQIQNDKDNIKTIERLLLKADLENRAGKGSNRDVVEATNDLADAKNSLNDRYVSYLIDTLNLQQEMGLLFVDKEGKVVR